MTNKYFKVKAKCGHVSISKCVLKDFPIKAVSGKEAAYLVRNCPRVKHDRKYAIINVEELNYEEFLSFKEVFKSDPYFQCKNIQEQRLLCGNLIHEIQEDDEYRGNNRYFEYDREERRKKVAYIMLKNKYKYEYKINY